MKDRIKRFIPIPIRKSLHRLHLATRAWRHRGHEVHCVCCNNDYARFLPMREGSHPRPNASCPGCGAVERHRMLLNYLKQHEVSFFPKGTRILYIAPMHGIRNYLKALPDANYLGADLESALAEAHFDLQDIPYPANSFDFCICSHTLAHIPDDLLALRELHRVMSANGRLLVLERIYPRPHTYQHDAAKTSADRLKHYEQADRWRIYGEDFADRLASAGFDVTEEYPAKEWSQEKIVREGIDPTESTFMAMKPQTPA